MESNRQGRTYRSNACGAPVCILIKEFTHDGIQGMDRNLDPAKLERDINERVTRNSPKLVLFVVHGTRDAAIDSIRNVSRDLSEGEAGVEDANKLTVRR